MPDGRSTPLAAAAERLRADVGSLVPTRAAVAGDAPAVVREILDGLLDVLDRPGVPSPAVLEALERAERLEQRALRADREARARGVENVGRGVVELHGCGDATEVVHRVCAIALEACGADDVVSGLLHEGTWVPLDRASRDGGARSLRESATPVGLAGLAVEREVARSGCGAPAPARPDVGGVPTSRPCVVVPLPVGGRVRGLLHLTFPGDAATADDIARAERFGHAVGLVFEALDLRGQLEALDQAVGRLRGVLETRSAEHRDAATLSGRPRAAGAQGRVGSGGPRGLAADLTPRQKETLELVLAGLSNAQIAERLVVGVPTVKSHVRAILRAVGAVNRAEAIGRYLEGREAASRDTHLSRVQ